MFIIEWLVDLKFVVGLLAGALVMFFVARKNPEWIQSMYAKQRGLSMKGTEEVEKLQAKVAEFELDKKITEKATEIYNKMKELGK